MIFAKVIGTVVASQKEENLRGRKLLLCKETDARGNPLSTYHVAADAVGAGEGDFVLVTTGSAARMTEQTGETPVDAVVMAIIDAVDIDSPRQFGRRPMKLGKIVGKVWAVRKVESLVGVRLLVVQPLAADGGEQGGLLVAADPHGLAGSGDTVVYVTSTDAADAFEENVPVNASVVMLVDSVE